MAARGSLDPEKESKKKPSEHFIHIEGVQSQLPGFMCGLSPELIAMIQIHEGVNRILLVDLKKNSPYVVPALLEGKENIYAIASTSEGDLLAATQRELLKFDIKTLMNGSAPEEIKLAEWEAQTPYYLQCSSEGDIAISFTNGEVKEINQSGMFAGLLQSLLKTSHNPILNYDADNTLQILSEVTGVKGSTEYSFWQRGYDETRIPKILGGDEHIAFLSRVLVVSHPDSYVVKFWDLNTSWKWRDPDPLAAWRFETRVQQLGVDKDKHLCILFRDGTIVMWNFEQDILLEKDKLHINDPTTLYYNPCNDTFIFMNQSGDLENHRFLVNKAEAKKVLEQALPPEIMPRPITRIIYEFFAGENKAASPKDSEPKSGPSGPGAGRT